MASPNVSGIALDYTSLVFFSGEETRHADGTWSCIGAAAAMVDVAERFGVVVRPMSVRVQVHNPAFPTVEGGRQVMAIGHPSSDGLSRVGPKDWAGHLVGIVDDYQDGRPALFDPTIAQLDNPAFGIASKLICYLLPSVEALATPIEFRAAEGCKYSYVCLPDDRSYETAGAWARRGQRTVARDRITQRMINEVRIKP